MGALVRVDDPVTRKSLSREVDLSRVPAKTLPRYLALAIAELVEASWAELTLPRRVVEPTGLAPPAEVRAAAEAQVRAPGPVRLEGFGVARRLLATNFWQVGGGGRAFISGERWGGELELEAAHGARHTSLGLVSADSVTLAAELTWRAPEQGALTFVAGAGGRAGLGFITGTPSDVTQATGGTIASAWVGPCVSARGEWRLGALFLSATLEGGLSLLGLRGTIAGAGGPGLAGAWLGLSLGFGGRP